MAAKIRNPLKNNQRTLAVFSASMASNYNAAIVFGATDCARAHGYNIITFAGGPHSNPDVVAQARSRIFEAVDPQLFAGLILPLGSLTRYISPEETDQFLAPYKAMPIACIGTQRNDTISIMADQGSGMPELLDHLIIDHGYRHIALACGPANHTASIDKIKVYKAKLAEYGITFNPDYILHGNLNRNASNWCTQTLFDERKLPVDVIVSVNDNQAFAIIESLKERGLHVPGDIAVTGCMDILEASVSTPALTTLHEPMYELGWAAAEAVIAALNGGDWHASHTLKSKVVIRESCGCSAHSQHAASITNLHSSAQTSPQQFIQQVLDAAELATASIDSDLDKVALTQACKRIITALSLGQVEQELSALEADISAHIQEDNIGGWLCALPLLARYCVQRLPTDHTELDKQALRERFENSHARLSQKAFNYRLMSADKAINAFRELSIFLNASFDVEVIRRLVVRDLNLTDCYVSIYVKKDQVRGKVKNILSIHERQLLSIDAEHLIHPSQQLLPLSMDTLPERYGLIVLPMSFRSEPIGYVIVDVF